MMKKRTRDNVVASALMNAAALFMEHQNTYFCSSGPSARISLPVRYRFSDLNSHVARVAAALTFEVELVTRGVAISGSEMALSILWRRVLLSWLEINVM